MTLALYCACSSTVGFAWGYVAGWIVDVMQQQRDDGLLWAVLFYPVGGAARRV